MGNAAQVRQRVLALFLPVAAVLYIGGEAISPKGTDQVLSNTATAFKVLPIAAQHPAQLYLASSLVLLGLGALAVSYGCDRHAGQGPWVHVGYRRRAARRTRRLLRSHLQRRGLSQPRRCCHGARITRRGREAAGDGHQFRVRPCLPVRVPGQRISRTAAHGDCPVAKPHCSSLARGPVLRRPASRRADGLVRAGRCPVHAAVRGRDGPAGRPDLARRQPCRTTGAAPWSRVTVPAA